MKKQLKTTVRIEDFYSFFDEFGYFPTTENLILNKNWEFLK